MFHDHTERAFTTNGQGEGGSISLLAYKDFVDENGNLKVSHSMDLKPYFTREFWERKIPVWQDFMDDWGSLGAPAGTMDTKPGINAGATEASAQAAASGIGGDGTGGGLLGGLGLGVALYFAYQHRDRLINQVKSLLPKSKG
jgi:hypothetical protein